MRCLIVILAAIIIVTAGITLFLFSGAYNVSALVPHWAVTRWFLEVVRDRSISTHSEGMRIPPSEKEALAVIGSVHFSETCRLCHGAPGFDREEFALGLYPSPPSLSIKGVQQEWSDGELYWIVKNGLKMTGMPAFGPTHDEEELRAIVAFLRALPDLQPEEFKELIEEGRHSVEGEHHH